MRYDIHCHLDSYDDPASIVSRAKESGVGLILTNGTGPDSNRKALALAERFPEVEAALGLYPTDAVELSDEEVDAVLDGIKQRDPIAIGEVGIDYHYDDTHKKRMRDVFTKVLDLAEEIKKPLLIHSRKAEADVIELLEGRSVVADMHCFGGSLKLAKRAAAMGCYFSIPATIVRATHFQRLVEEVPMEQLLTETDSPWLSPDREKKNEPANIVLVVKEIARIKGLSEEECARLLWENASRFLSRS